MCFSAEASFAGGVIISAIGIATMREVHKPSQLIFACIPIFFGIQQIAEGVLWLTLPNPEYIQVQKIATYIFLFMAEVFWPVMVPVAALFMEESKKRKWILWVLVAMGISLALYYTYCLFSFNVTPKIIIYHIQYDNEFPVSLVMLTNIIYLMTTIIPLFVSSIKRTHLLGVLIFLSCLITAIFFTQYLTSVWCFFAALVSGVIFWILMDSKKKFKLDKINLLRNHFRPQTHQAQ
jgi:hypothetical protein